MSTSRDPTNVRLWSHDGTLLRTLSGHEQVVSCLEFSPDGQTLASSSDDQTVRIWSLDGRPLAALHGTAGLTDIVWSSGGDYLASIGGFDTTVRIWSKTGDPGPVLENCGYPVLAAGFSADSRHLVTVGDSAIRLWKLEGRPGIGSVNV